MEDNIEKYEAGRYFQERRERVDLSRKMVAAQTDISPSRLERIETQGAVPTPEEIQTLANLYKDPSLANYYCMKVCPIGREEGEPINSTSLSQSVLGILASLNYFSKWKERLIEIAADGKISREEMREYMKIRDMLDDISKNIEALDLWYKTMRARGEFEKLSSSGVGDENNKR